MFSFSKVAKKEDDRPQPEKLKLIKQKTESGRRQQQQVVAPKQLHKQGSDDDKDSVADDASFIASLKEREQKEPVRTILE
jgi:hypothetical protein